jgi:hypothetical protein
LLARPATPRPWSLTIASAALAGSLATASGCGGSAPRAAATSYAPGARGLDEALADLDAAEAQILAQLGPPSAASGPAQPGGVPARQAAPAAPPPPPPAGAGEAPAAAPLPAAPAPADDETAQAEARDAGGGCALACRALASMRRAAEHVCRAAGAGDARCDRALQRVDGADRRVREACEACKGE